MFWHSWKCAWNAISHLQVTPELIAGGGELFTRKALQTHKQAIRSRRLLEAHGRAFVEQAEG